MKPSRTSVMKVASLKPEVEFEVIKLVLLRENYLKRLEKQLNQSKGSVDISIIGSIEILRDCTIETVESILMWERTQLDYPLRIQKFIWNGLNYLEKLSSDIEFLDSYPAVVEWLGFSLHENPFIVPPNLLQENFSIDEKSFAVFGNRPKEALKQYIKKKKTTAFLKSPYNTPIINDPNIIPTLSIVSKFMKEEKGRQAVVTNNRDKASDAASDPFETFLSHSYVKRIKYCWRVLRGLNDDLGNITEAKQEHTEKESLAFDNEFEKKNLDLLNRLRNASIVPVVENKALRTIEKTSDNSSVKIWTPHDIILQRAVQKKGGELSVLTAAGVRGKMKVPWRKSRYERNEKDLESLTERLNSLCLKIEENASKSSVINEEYFRDIDRAHMTKQQILDVESEDRIMRELRKKLELNQNLLKYQLSHFKKLTHGNSLNTLEHRRKLRNLEDGEALDVDEKESMKLEDEMARKIQSRAFIKFGRIMRKGLLKRMNAAAVKIQMRYRKYKTSSLSLMRIRQIALALLLQKWHRSRFGKEILARLKREAEENFSSRLIQRVYRGYLGRKRFLMKLEFTRRIKAAGREVDPLEFSPGHVEELCDLIDLYIRDYTVNLPPSVLTVLRGILYMFNGSTGESVIVENAGYIEEKFLFASSLSWYGARLLLSRKGRFIRRLRALVRSVSVPNPVTLKFNEECLKHLDCLQLIDEKDFEALPFGKVTIVKLFRYSFHLYRVQKLQHIFTEYFDASQPDWFHSIMKMRLSYERLSMKVRSETVCRQKIELHRQHCIEEGKKIGPISRAHRKIVKSLNKSIADLNIITEKLKKFIVELEVMEKNKIIHNRNLERSRALGVDIARRDLKDYLRNAVIVDDNRVKELQYVVDKKELDLLECRAIIEALQQGMERDAQSRNFEKLLKMKKIQILSDDLGSVLGDLMVLNEMWSDFVDEIGGIQFAFDVVGERKVYFDKVKNAACYLMKRRRELIEKVDSGIKQQFANVKRHAYLEKLKLMSEQWDLPTPVEEKAEKEENRECARRDADIALKERRQADQAYIPPTSKIPVILVLDTRIPEASKDFILKTLTVLKFVVLKSNQEDPEVVIEIQHLFDNGYDVIFFVDRGMHRQARAEFHALFGNILSALIPYPKVVTLDASTSFRMENWYSAYKSKFPRSEDFDKPGSDICTLSIAKLRRIALFFRECMYGSTDLHRASPILTSCFRVDFSNFLSEISLSRASDETLTQASSLENGAMILAATISCILGLWDAPLLYWKERQINIGCIAFLNACENMENVCDLLFLNPFPVCNHMSVYRVKQARMLEGMWKTYSNLHIHEFPARYLLSQWCLEAIFLVEAASGYGGLSSELFPHHLSNTNFLVDWNRDITPVVCDYLIGQIVKSCLKDWKIFETSGTVTLYYNRSTYKNADKRVIGEDKITQQIEVYHRGNDTYVGINVQRNENLPPTTFFKVMTLKDVVTMTHPNSVEIFEGRIKKYDIGESGKQKWFELVSTWARLDDVSDIFKVHLLRARYLILSRLGYVNGYFARYEIYEERYGEILILIHGIHRKNAVEFRVTRENLATLLSVADIYEEKNKLEAFDTPAMASIYSDRLEIHPPLQWKALLESGELLPSVIDRPIKCKLRTNRGPGRFMGRQLVHLFGLSILVTLYELNNDTDSHALRVCMYEIKGSQSVEYRLSPMERVSLFTNDRPLILQIIDRMKVVYCDLEADQRALIKLDDNFTPKDHYYEVDGDIEYSIITKSVEFCFPDSHSHSGSNAMDDEDDEDVEEVNDINVAKHLQNDNSSASSNGTMVLKYLDKQWGWAVYFNRTVLSDFKGNLIVSIGLNVSMRGFLISVLDGRSLVEAFRFVSFEESCNIFFDYTIPKIEEQLKTLDEASVFELVDELMSTIDIAPHENDDLVIKLTSERDLNNRDIPIAVARIRNEESISPWRKPRNNYAPRDIVIKVLEIKGLSKNGSITRRNPYCVVKFNMREIGKTSIAKNTLHPVWDNAEFKTASNRGQRLSYCLFELEVFDTDYLGNEGEFLGCLRFSGEAVVRFLLSVEPTWYKLDRSNRFSDNENKSVGGRVFLQCSLEGDITDIEDFFPNLVHAYREAIKPKPPPPKSLFSMVGASQAATQLTSMAKEGLGWIQGKLFGKKSSPSKSPNKSNESKETDGKLDASEERGRSREKTPKDKRSASETPTKSGTFSSMLGMLSKRAQSLSPLRKTKEDDSNTENNKEEKANELDEHDSDEDHLSDLEEESVDEERQDVDHLKEQLFEYHHNSRKGEFVVGVSLDGRMTKNAFKDVDINKSIEEEVIVSHINQLIKDTSIDHSLALLKEEGLSNNLTQQFRIELFLVEVENWCSYVDGFRVVYFWNGHRVTHFDLKDSQESKERWNLRDGFVTFDTWTDSFEECCLTLEIRALDDDDILDTLSLCGHELTLFLSSGSVWLPLVFKKETQLRKNLCKTVDKLEERAKKALEASDSMFSPSKLFSAFGRSKGGDEGGDKNIEDGDNILDAEVLPEPVLNDQDHNLQIEPIAFSDLQDNSSSSFHSPLLHSPIEPLCRLHIRSCVYKDSLPLRKQQVSLTELSLESINKELAQLANNGKSSPSSVVYLTFLQNSCVIRQNMKAIQSPPSSIWMLESPIEFVYDGNRDFSLILFEILIYDHETDAKSLTPSNFLGSISISGEDIMISLGIKKKKLVIDMEEDDDEDDDDEEEGEDDESGPQKEKKSPPLNESPPIEIHPGCLMRNVTSSFFPDQTIDCKGVCSLKFSSIVDNWSEYTEEQCSPIVYASNWPLETSTRGGYFSHDRIDLCIHSLQNLIHKKDSFKGRVEIEIYLNKKSVWISSEISMVTGVSIFPEDRCDLQLSLPAGISLLSCRLDVVVWAIQTSKAARHRIGGRKFEGNDLFGLLHYPRIGFYSTEITKGHVKDTNWCFSSGIEEVDHNDSVVLSCKLWDFSGDSLVYGNIEIGTLGISGRFWPTLRSSPPNSFDWISFQQLWNQFVEVSIDQIAGLKLPGKASRVYLEVMLGNSCCLRSDIVDISSSHPVKSPICLLVHPVSNEFMELPFTIALWDAESETCLGGVVIVSSVLMDLRRKFIASFGEISFQDNLLAKIYCGDGYHSSIPLEYFHGFPVQSFMSPKIQGNVDVTIKLGVEPNYDKIKASLFAKSKRTMMNNAIVIESSMNSDQLGWRYGFGEDIDSSSNATLSNNRASFRKDSSHFSNESSFLSKRKTSTRSLRSAYSEMKMKKKEDTEEEAVVTTLSESLLTTVTNPLEDEEDGYVHTKKSGSRTAHIKVELPAMSFIFKEREVENEDRICWRGRVMPRNFISTSGARSKVMLSRSSRVVKTKKINEASVLADISYIKDINGEDEISEQLPICAKEIVSEGPGLVRTLYRVELSANNGQKMGHADIEDNKEEFEDVLGVDGRHLIQEDRSLWNLGNIFEYIVRERTILEMMPLERDLNKSGRRDGYIGVSDEQLDHSTVKLLRDSQVKASMGKGGSSKPGDVSILEENTAEDAKEELIESHASSPTKASVLPKNQRMYWNRLCIMNQKLSGRPYRAVLVALSTEQLIDTNPNKFYTQFASPNHLFSSIHFEFRLKDLWRKSLHRFDMSGSTILNWIYPGFPIDFSTKFRRMKFGEYIITNLSMTYLSDGSITFSMRQEYKPTMEDEEPEIMDDFEEINTEEILNDKNKTIPPKENQDIVTDSNKIE